jgi:hypothetical protein
MSSAEEKPAEASGEAGARTPTAGGCACGGVRFEVRGRLSSITVCHCSQCRKFHGAAGPYTMCRREKLTFTSDSTLRWYRSSERVRRGFCGECGASLFWDGDDSPFMAIAAGSLENASQLRVSAHIYAASRADWEHLEDGLPRHDEDPPSG